MFETLRDHLLEDAVAIGVVAVAVLVLFGGAEIASRLLRLPTEWTRKATHLGGGAVVMSFPWLLRHDVSVVVLALAFAGVLVGGRITGLLGSIHNVERRTGGAYYYPFAVLGAWILSGGDALLFCVPLAIMAIADTGAALVGQAAGQTTFVVMDGKRSVEGSVTFFGLAFAIALVGCALAGRPGWPDVLLVTLVVATLTTAVEAVSVRGSDNVAIPYAGWLALDHTGRIGLDALGDWILGMTLGVTVLLVSARRARLDAAGALVVFLVSTLAFALGGVRWFLPMGALYGGYLATRDPAENSLDRVFPTTAGAMVVVLLFAHTEDPSLYLAYLTAVATNGAMAGLLVAGTRGWPRAPLAFAGAAGPVLVAAMTGEAVPLWIPLAGAVVGVGLLRLLRRGPPVGRRALISLAVGLGAWTLFRFSA